MEPACVGVRGDEVLDGDDERGDRRLHVGGAAAVQIAVAHRSARTDRSATRRAAPSARRRCGPRSTPPGAASPRRAHRLVTPLRLIVSQTKPSGARRSMSSCLAAGVVGRLRAARDQFTGKIERRRAAEPARSPPAVFTAGG